MQYQYNTHDFRRTADSLEVSRSWRAANDLANMDIPLSAHSIVAASPHQVSCPLGDEAAILNMKNAIYYGLDAVGARIWDLLQKPRSVGEIRDTLLEEYDVEAERCERDLLGLLEKMRSEGLVEVRSAAGR